MVPYVSREEIARKLPVIFPEGTPNRNHCTRASAAIAIFTLLYIDAVEGSSVYLAPADIYRMTEEQAGLQDPGSRKEYALLSAQGKSKLVGRRLYADNSREQIRDESFRDGLIPLGAVKVLPGIATTSKKGRYFLDAEFADLFNPSLTDEAFLEAVAAWHAEHLSPQALLRMRLVGLVHQSLEGQISIRFPNGATQTIDSGPSEVITKAVVEVFAARFLRRPGVLWLSTSKNKVVESQLELARSIGLDIRADLDLPDVILVDLEPEHPLFAFVEVVASDGPVGERRKQAIYALTDAGNIDRRHVVFVTAYLDRESGAFSKTAKSIAWNSFAWFMSEPEKLMVFRDGTFLSDLVL
jgi:hypothetical protein